MGNNSPECENIYTLFGIVFYVSHKNDLMKYIVIILIVCFLTACNNSDEMNTTTYSNTTTESPATNTRNNDSPKETDETGCYMKVTGRYTAILMIDQKGKEISGMMLYDNYQKDGAVASLKEKKMEIF